MTQIELKKKIKKMQNDRNLMESGLMIYIDAGKNVSDFQTRNVFMDINHTNKKIINALTEYASTEILSKFGIKIR